MRFLVKPMDFPNAFMYGAGHGGVEAMLLCGVASISNIASAVMINSGTMSAQLATLDAEKAADTAAALSALWTTPSLTFFAGGVERIIAVVLHLSLSILVFQSIRKSPRKTCSMRICSTLSSTRCLFCSVQWHLSGWWSLSLHS